MTYVCIKSATSIRMTTFKTLRLCCNRRQKIMTLFVAVLLIIIIIITKRNSSVTLWVCGNDILEGAQPPSDKSNCIDVPEKGPGKSLLGHKPEKTLCDNILNNMTIGRWIEKTIHAQTSKRHELDMLLQDFRVFHEGFSKLPYREDKQCGFWQLPKSKACGFLKVDASAWCDPYSSTPCCTDKYQGYCVPENECQSKDKVNLASYSHAELSRWQTSDSRCSWVEYNQMTACSLLHNRDIRQITFIGNSLMRNMYSVFLQMLTDNYHNGSVVACMPPSMRKKCVDYMQNMDKYCLGIALAQRSTDLPGPGICDGQIADLSVDLKMFYLASFAQELKEYVKSLIGKRNSYVLVGIGVHDQYLTKTIVGYLEPSLELVKGQTWPKLIWVHTVKSGLFKPPQFMSMHGTDEDIDKYIDGMNKYCHSHNIPTIDLRHLTSGIWSVEGTHFGTAVNKMKLQIFLNYLNLQELQT